ncbi:HET-domain-containing protein [Diplogelasinospora grovesii]|uniref:HET-domain-containing protein n=1 Tax=Diplogelasinospora grovesii TaxID=303347 RepID=A0AAN6S949_9PEZI|nr:HET-domain-containing protein [Diplogelasinospora grovesii]
MRLIDAKTFELKEFMGSNVPQYAILSHTWEDGEVTFQDYTQLTRTELRKKKGYTKIERTCRLALNSGIKWAWVDTCCIDKTSSAELTEAINSMFRWYAESAVCYAYLSDLEADKKHDGTVEKYRHCRWFTRGWTLQELIAPRRLGFYNRKWEFQGEKQDLGAELAEITKISKRILGDSSLLQTVSVAQRMSWAAGRQTTRTEDMAYCLLGIFDVQIPLLYGEGSKAFTRLQEEVAKESNDLSLFAWRSASTSSQKYAGILASSPDAFARSADIELWGYPMFNDECLMTSKGLRVTPSTGSGLAWGKDGTYVLGLKCHYQNSRKTLGIFLRQHGDDVYTRIWPDELAQSSGDGDFGRIVKNRTSYMMKTVTPVLSVSLTTSHRQAINLQNALKSLSKRGFSVADASFQPRGHWDSQREMFLTQGVSDFSYVVRFGRSPLGPLTLVCRLHSPDLSVSLDRDGHSSGGKTIITQTKSGEEVLTARVEKGSMQGQLVFFVHVDYEHLENSWR